MVFGAMVLGCGLVGLGYCGLAWRDAVRDGLSRPRSIWRIGLWYAVLPVVAYLVEAAAGVLLGMERAEGCAVLAVSTGVAAGGRHPQRVGHHGVDHHATAGVRLAHL